MAQSSASCCLLDASACTLNVLEGDGKIWALFSCFYKNRFGLLTSSFHSSHVCMNVCIKLFINTQAMIIRAWKTPGILSLVLHRDKGTNSLGRVVHMKYTMVGRNNADRNRHWKNGSRASATGRSVNQMVPNSAKPKHWASRAQRMKTDNACTRRRNSRSIK